MELLLQGAAAAASVGMGCGTCCGSGMGVFLSGYLMTHAKNVGQSLRAFLSFYLGKLMAVMGLCGGASLLGSRLLDAEGCLFGVPVKAVVDVAMILVGLGLLVQWVLERKGHRACHACGSREPKPMNAQVSFPVLWLMGVGYGVSPCGPLLMMLGYAATVPLSCALAVGAVFALCSAVSPMLLLLLLSGALAGRMYREIPQYLSWFRLGCYILLVIFFAAELGSVL